MRPETFVHVIYVRKKTKFTQKRSSLNIAEGDQWNEHVEKVKVQLSFFFSLSIQN